MLAYENKNMAEFLKFNDKTLTDTDVGDIATSTNINVWSRFRTSQKLRDDVRDLSFRLSKIQNYTIMENNYENV